MMNKGRLFQIFFLIGMLSLGFVWGEISSANQILYLMQANQVERSLELYKQEVEKLGKNDFSLLEQMGYILLDQGARSHDEEEQLLSMYGASIATAVESMDIYDIGITSTNPITQMATIQFLTQIQDDRSEEILFKAFHSPFLAVRMEASYALAYKKMIGQRG